MEYHLSGVMPFTATQKSQVHTSPSFCCAHLAFFLMKSLAFPNEKRDIIPTEMMSSGTPKSFRPGRGQKENYNEKN